MESFLETIVLAIFKYPGAIIRFGLSKLFGSKRNFSDFLEDEDEANAAVAIAAILAISILVVIWINN